MAIAMKTRTRFTNTHIDQLLNDDQINPAESLHSNWKYSNRECLIIFLDLCAHGEELETVGEDQ
jgi:hypothetical protein